MRLLLDEGVSRARAVRLATRFSAQEIVQQVRWLDGRRYDDRAACLVAAIEGCYGPPVASPPRGVQRSLPTTSPRRTAGASPAVYTGGAYGVCPACLSSPCDPECPLSESDASKPARGIGE